MDYTDSAPAAPLPARPPRWQTAALLLVLAALFASSMLSLRGEQGKKADDTARLLLDTALKARLVYALRSMSLGSAGEGDRTQQEVLRDLAKLAEVSPSPLALRRLALMQRLTGDPHWAATLLRLRALPLTTASAFDIERELAMWGRVLDNARYPSPTRPPPGLRFGQPPEEESRLHVGDVEVMRAQIKRMELGWYAHLALEALYRRAGMTQAAKGESDAARQTWFAMILLGLLALGVGLLGLALGGGAVVFFFWRRANPNAALPRPLRFTPPLPLARPQADALYTVFLVYLMAFALVRFGAGWILRPLLAGAGMKMTPAIGMTLSLALMACSLALPFAAFRRLAARYGLTAADIGLHLRTVWGDIVWGIGGYAVWLPLLWITSLLSTWLFRGFETPLNPAITEFAGSHNLLLQLLLFAEAALLAPLVEETLFRGVFFRSLMPRVGQTGAILIASGVFALLHPQLPLGFLGIFTLGALFNVLYVLRGSLIPGMVTHAINNGAIFCVLTLVLGDG